MQQKQAIEEGDVIGFRVVKSIKQEGLYKRCEMQCLCPKRTVSKAVSMSALVNGIASSCGCKKHDRAYTAQAKVLIERFHRMPSKFFGHNKPAKQEPFVETNPWEWAKNLDGEHQGEVK